MNKLHYLEHPRGPNAAPAIVKHCVRFGRRLRDHGLYDFSFPTYANDSYASVRVGRRIVMLDSDGDYRPCLRPFERSGAPLMFDPQAISAHRHRIHAICLNMAAQARRMGWLTAARSDLSVAIHSRRTEHGL